MPAPPDYEWCAPPRRTASSRRRSRDCNWLQALEGGLDTSHSSFLAQRAARRPSWICATATSPRGSRSSGPTTATRYAVDRATGRRGQYVRVVPLRHAGPADARRRHGAATAAATKVPTIDGHIWVPIDDETTLVYNCSTRYDRERADHAGVRARSASASAAAAKTTCSRDFKLEAQHVERLPDRPAAAEDAERSPGSSGVNTQDMALQEGMGPIVRPLERAPGDDRQGDHRDAAAAARSDRRRRRAVSAARQRSEDVPASCDRTTTTSRATRPGGIPGPTS